VNGLHIRIVFGAALALLAAIRPAMAEAESVPAPNIYLQQRDDGGFEFLADNPAPIAYSVWIEIPGLVNLEADVELPYIGVIEPGRNGQRLIVMRVIDPTQGYGVTESKFSMHPGRVDREPDLDHVYLLPYEHGAQIAIGQAYGGSGQGLHKGDGRYAIDFSSVLGTPVHAVRDGIVIGVREDSEDGGIGEQFAAAANYINVYHEDGTIAGYGHLMKDGSEVEIGDRVKAGQLIGYSGNSGYSSGPHLHFAVSRYAFEDSSGGGVKSETLPLLFLGRDGTTLTVEEGQSYYAYHPGGEPFAEESAAEAAPAGEVPKSKPLTDADYQGFIEPLPPGDDVAVTIELVNNDTYVFFGENETSEAREITLRISLVNMAASKPLPYRQTVPPNSRVYLLMVRAIDGDAKTDMSPQYFVQ
jgi:murein DD-endopeptidase MepM/ murein hydrolase activator NlpD